MTELVKYAGQRALTDLESFLGSHITDGEDILIKGAKDVYVLYTVDSLDSLVAAAILQRMHWKHAKSLATAGVTTPDAHFNLHIESIVNASIPEDAPFVVWLGMQPTPAVFKTGRPGLFQFGDPKIPKGVKNITVTANPQSYPANRPFTEEVEAIWQECYGGDQPAPAYGLIIDLFSKLAEQLNYSASNPMICYPNLAAYLIDVQTAVNQFDMRHTMDLRSPKEQSAAVVKAFALGVAALKTLKQAGGMIDMTDADKAYRMVLSNVRAQLARNGHRAESAQRGPVLHAWFTHISEFYWVARRQVQHSHKFYVNVTKCRTGDFIYTNVPSGHTVNISQQTIRSS